MTLRFLKALATVTGFFLILAQPAAAQSARSTLQSAGSTLQQDIINGVVQNIIQNVRDQIHARLVSPPGRLGFNADESDFDNRDPFAVHGSPDPFRALGYAKAPAMAPDPGSAWLYGVNVVGAGDRSVTSGIGTYVSTVTGAFDVTKIGIFTSSDALTFIATGSDSWGHQGGLVSVDTSTPSPSGTLSYSNGGFSADFTGFASWTRTAVSIVPFPAAVMEGSLLGYTGNAQYRFDLPYSVFIEPTIGVTYTEGYTANFGAKISDTTEVHGGARFGTEMKWMGYKVQPTLSASVYQIVDSSAVGVVGSIIPSSMIGFRGSGKVTVIWTPSFSSFLEAHASGMTGASQSNLAFSTTQTTGAQAGLRNAAAPSGGRLTEDRRPRCRQRGQARHGLK